MQKLDPRINLNTFSNFSGDLGLPYRYSAETNRWKPLLNFFRNYQFKCGRNCRLRLQSNVRIQHHTIHAEYNFVAGCWTTMFKEFDHTVGVERCRDMLFQPFSVFFCFRMYAKIWNSFNGPSTSFNKIVSSNEWGDVKSAYTREQLRALLGSIGLG